MTKRANRQSVKIVAPKHAIGDKVRVGGEHAVTTALLDKVDRDIVANLGSQYLEWVSDDLRKLEAALAELHSGDDIESSSMRRFRAVLHEIRGMGGTFGFQLVSTIADQMHRMVHKFDAIDAARIDALTVHTDALKLVVSENLREDGGARGREVLRGLQKVYEKYV
ncbi:MAG: hypothetical protein HOH04_05605 [Rhodospirillaceae bacterium]|nr:hypothetical protein [Rhodospirillaceae bacterium]